jgi:flagellar biosynthesis activator protein FlaF
MRMTPYARTGYAQAAAPVRTDRSSEYAVFAKVTAGLKVADESDKAQFPALARAVYDNQRLWGALEDDLLIETNGLPTSLKAQLLGIANFVRRHSAEVLAGRASIAPLIDINTSIMKGLRGDVEVAA